MPKKRFNAEQIVTLLRGIDGARQINARGLSGINDIGAELRDEPPNGGIFCGLKEAQMVVEQLRFAPVAAQLDEIMLMQQSLIRWYKKAVRPLLRIQ